MSADEDKLVSGQQHTSGKRPVYVDCLEQLNRFVRSGVLAPDTRAYVLLSYLVDHYLTQGPDVPIKAYGIALDVLGRKADFDPSEDSIVRVEIGRLRKLLELYELGPGKHDPVRFRLPKGQSHLAVTFHNISEAPVGKQQAANGANPNQPGPSRFVQISGLMGGILLMLVAIAVLSPRIFPDTIEREIVNALETDYPRLFVRPFRKTTAITEAYPQNDISSFLAMQLSGFRGMQVIAPLPPTRLPIRPRDYVIDGVVAPTQGEVTNGLPALTLRLRDGLGTLIWTHRIEIGLGNLMRSDQVFSSLSEISSSLGGSLGVITAAGRERLEQERSDWAIGSTSDFECFIRWQSFDVTKDPDLRAQARSCLEDRAEADTPIAHIWSATAFMRFLDWSEGSADAEDGKLTAALVAANRAVLLDPAGADGYEALGSILTAQGQLHKARAALIRALELNPSNLETVVKIGWLDCLEGDWQTGSDRINAVIERYHSVPGWYRLPLALAAFQSGNFEAMNRQAREIVLSGDRRGLVLQLAAVSLTNDAQGTIRLHERLERVGLTPVSALAEIEVLFPDAALFQSLQEQF